MISSGAASPRPGQTATLSRICSLAVHTAHTWATHLETGPIFGQVTEGRIIEVFMLPPTVQQLLQLPRGCLQMQPGWEAALHSAGRWSAT